MKVNAKHALVSDQIDKLLHMCENIAIPTLFSCPPSLEGEEQAVKEQRVVAPPKVPDNN